MNKLTIKQISEKSGLKLEVAESLYWHCIWLRDAKPDTKVMWRKLLWDKDYRLNRNHK